MASYRQMNKTEWEQELDRVKLQYDQFKALSLKLNMARGKPGPDQLDLADPLLTVLKTGSDCVDSLGNDCRNYGILDGIEQTKKLFAEIMDVSPDMVIVGGNASLTMMFDFIGQGCYDGFGGTPWSEDKNRKFLCPAPGYDRHFAIAEYFGFELVPVAMLDDGPDMEEIERLVKDPSVKGIWCVPKYSNPQGITYSDEVVERFAALKPACDNFKIMWDNAYIIHHLNDTPDQLLNIFSACEKHGSQDMVAEFTSTSKITFAGAGVGAMAVSPAIKKAVIKRMTVQTISADKLNQLRHAKLYPNIQAVEEHMKKHAAILSPKFDLVCDMLEDQLGDKEILSWHRPNGGYFISIDTLPGCAQRVVALCKEAGVELTGAGATFPNQNDPLDSNIRIAPSYPSLDELEKATQLLILSIEMATLEMLLSDN